VIRVLIIAPYAAVRAGLRALLEVAGDIEVVGEAGSHDTVRHLLEISRVDAVVLDSVAADLDVLPLIQEFDIAWVSLTDDPEAWVRLVNRDLPGWGLLRKEADGREIVNAVRAVANDLIVLDHTMGYLIASAESPPDAEQPPTESFPNAPLSAREREVLQLMALGLPNKQIAARLSISLSTVKFHVASILAKTGASSRTEAVTLGIRRGAVSL